MPGHRGQQVLAAASSAHCGPRSHALRGWVPRTRRSSQVCCLCGVRAGCSWAKPPSWVLPPLQAAELATAGAGANEDFLERLLSRK